VLIVVFVSRMARKAVIEAVAETDAGRPTEVAK